MIVAGIDPGLAAAGLSVTDSTSLRCYRAWTVRTAPSMSLEARLHTIEHQLKIALYDYLDGADLLAIEDQHDVFHAQLRAGLSNPNAGRLERVVGIAHGLAAARGIEVVMVTPAEIRSLLGCSGRAKKTQIARAVRMQVSGVQPGISGHAVDAVAIALAGARKMHGQEIKMRAVNEALGAGRTVGR